jgi:hypothetical protein
MISVSLSNSAHRFFVKLVSSHALKFQHLVVPILQSPRAEASTKANESPPLDRNPQGEEAQLEDLRHITELTGLLFSLSKSISEEFHPKVSGMVVPPKFQSEVPVQVDDILSTINGCRPNSWMRVRELLGECRDPVTLGFVRPSTSLLFYAVIEPSTDFSRSQASPVGNPQVPSLNCHR